MNIPQRLLPALLLVVLMEPARAGVRSPDERPVTDPKSLTAEMRLGAGPLSIDELFYTRAVSGGSWSPDGREVLFTTNLAGRLNLWKISASSGFPIQLAQSEDRQMLADWSPRGDWIVYQQDKAGGEYYDLMALPANGGPALNLTSTPDYSETGATWSPDGGQVAFTRKKKGEPNNNLAILDWATRKVRPLTTNSDRSRNWNGQTWSHDGKYLFVASANFGRTDSDLYRIEVATGTQERLTPHPGERFYTLGDVSPDGRHVLVSSNQKEGFANAALIDVSSKALTWITDLRWEVIAGQFSPDGRWFTYAVNEDGRTELYLVASASRKAERLNLPVGVSSFASRSPFSPDGRKLLISHQSSQRPEDFWIYDLAGKSANQLTVAALAGLDPQRIPASQLVHYRSFDGKIISAFLWLPFNVRQDGRSPGILYPHGGPTAQRHDTFDRTVAAWVSRGYVVLAPNPRGSTGYGMEFQNANHNDLGGGDLQDVIFGAKFLAATGYVDAGRIGISGGSYGGFLTLMALMKTPDVWAAGVQVFGIINWFTMWQHSDAALQGYQRSLIGDPVGSKAIFEACSPITYIHQTKAPLLSLQGDNDIRVPKEEAVQVTKILQESGKIAEAHYYPNEGHGFTRRENQIDAIQRTLAWFDKYLKAAR